MKKNSCPAQSWPSIGNGEEICSSEWLFIVQWVFQRLKLMLMWVLKMLMKYILRLYCTIVTWSSGTSAADLIYPNVTESRSEKNGYWRSQKDFYKWFFIAGLPEINGFTWFYGFILEKHNLNTCTVKRLCNSKECALSSRGKFAEILLKCRPHKQGCFEMILQGGECLHGQVMVFLNQLVHLKIGFCAEVLHPVTYFHSE